MGRWWQNWEMAWEAGAWACRLTMWVPTLLMVLRPPDPDRPDFWWDRDEQGEMGSPHRK